MDHPSFRKVATCAATSIAIMCVIVALPISWNLWVALTLVSFSLPVHATTWFFMAHQVATADKADPIEFSRWCYLIQAANVLLIIALAALISEKSWISAIVFTLMSAVCASKFNPMFKK